MPAPLSIIIPVADNPENIGPCLGALGDALFEGLVRDVVFADYGPGAFADVAEETGAQYIAINGGGLPAAQREGVKIARGDWRMVLPPHTVLPRGWTAILSTHFKDAPKSPAAFRLAGSRGFSIHMANRLIGRVGADQPLILPKSLKLARRYKNLRLLSGYGTRL